MDGHYQRYLHRFKKSLSNYWLKVTNISKKHADILKVYKVLPKIYDKVLLNNKTSDRNDQKQLYNNQIG